ncbi:uncharacterized protein LOC141914059 [Tubulanus polymorphus]|uniref:uncharacterized protein LOC141914059 n=1 Tax=Tubulanus polymorphus TaxID=672921 RepID=UPI003DA24984
MKVTITGMVKRTMRMMTSGCSGRGSCLWMLLTVLALDIFITGTAAMGACYDCRGYLNGRNQDMKHIHECIYPKWNEDFVRINKKQCSSTGACLIYQTSIMGQEQEIVRSCPPEGTGAQIDCSYDNVQRMKQIIKRVYNDVIEFRFSRFICCDDMQYCNNSPPSSRPRLPTAVFAAVVTFVLTKLVSAGSW